MVRSALVTRRLTLAALSLALLAGLAPLGAGSYLMAPQRSVVGDLPADLAGEAVEIPSASGSSLRAWFVPGPPGAPGVALFHGVKGSRRAMLARTRWLHGMGFSVLLVDFQAHGESPGDAVTFGYLESMDAAAAVDYLRGRIGDAPVGGIGVSMGAAAAVLADPPLAVDALVVEAVYPSLEEAVADRLVMRLGAWGAVLTPVFTLQVWPRLGVPHTRLRPIDRVAELRMPKLFIAGTADGHTTIAESEAIYAGAAGPKEWWSIAGAGHVDFHAFYRSEYERRVGAFLAQHLGTHAR
jgi:pimeloyl-ACP methyl ester carboxylesterase